MANGIQRRPAKHNPFRAANLVGGATFTIGDEADDVINVAIQLKDANGRDIAERGAVFAYIASDANGDALATAPDALAIGTDGLAIEVISNSAMMLVSEADGDIDINITKSGAATYYVVLVMPDGSLVASSVITFAA